MTDDFTTALLAVWTTYLIATLVPGPNIVCVASSALLGGRARGLAAAAGVATATLGWATLGVAGLGALLDASPEAMPWLRWFGAAVLIWMGCATLRSAPGGARPGGSAGGYVQGVLTGMSNPLSAMIWVTAAGIILTTGPSIAERAFYLASCGGLALSIHGTVAVAVARVARPASPTGAAALRIVCGSSFLVLGGLMVAL